MKTLKLLNIAAFLLLFTPFFQMCSDDDGETDTATSVLGTPTDSLNVASSSPDSLQQLAPALSPAQPEEEPKTFIEAFWELITVPGDNFTTTAFGLFVITIFDIAEGHFSDIWIGSVITIISLVLTTATLVMLFKRRAARLVPVIMVNLVLIAAAFVAAALTFDSLAQVKWGYYLYLGTTVLLFLQARRERRLSE